MDPLKPSPLWTKQNAPSEEPRWITGLCYFVVVFNYVTWALRNDPWVVGATLALQSILIIELMRSSNSAVPSKPDEVTSDRAAGKGDAILSVLRLLCGIVMLARGVMLAQVGSADAFGSLAVGPWALSISSWFGIGLGSVVVANFLRAALKNRLRAVARWSLVLIACLPALIVVGAGIVALSSVIAKFPGKIARIPGEVWELRMEFLLSLAIVLIFLAILLAIRCLFGAMWQRLWEEHRGSRRKRP